MNAKSVSNSTQQSARKSLATIFVLALIRFYQVCLSPLGTGHCRYFPTCSQYALEAIQQFGALRGGWLAMRRLLSCHPLGGSGVDLVPEKLERRPRHSPSEAP